MVFSSDVITCIQSALDDLAGLMKPPVPSGTRALRFQLRNLKTFVLCSRKLVNHESLKSLLLWIEDVVRGKAKEIAAANYSLEMEYLEEEIQDWYITMFDYLTCDLRTDQLLDLMSSILESLVDVCDLRSSDLHLEMLGEAMETLREQMTFLKCLVQISPETSVDLMAHAQDVAINAAYLLFTCKRKGIKFNISCLVQKIMPIDPRVCGIYTQALRSRLARTHGMDGIKSLLNSLISNLWEILLQLNTRHLASEELQLQQLQLQQLYEGLRSLRTVIAQPILIEGELKEVIGAVVCDAGVLICSLYQSQADLPLHNLLESMNIIFEQLMGLTSYGEEPTAASYGDFLAENVESCNEQEQFEEAEVLEIFHDNGQHITNEMIGRHDDIRSLSDQLCRGSEELKIIAVVGMPGIGKTILASNIFNDALISSHFHYRAWCPVSQVEDQRKVLLQLLRRNAHGQRFEETEEYMVKLHRQLRGRRYLIFLDDVGSPEAWERLRWSFPNDRNGSRIILTSSHDVAHHSMQAGFEPHIVRKLTREESLQLLHRKLFPEQQGWPPEFKDLAMSFADLCGGLPSTVITMAGLLAGKKAKGWRAILDRFGLMMTKLELGSSFSMFDQIYKDLPDYLKPCFLYFATFPKDGVVSAPRLLRLWIAEGFVQKVSMYTPQDVAARYLKDLISQRLIMIVKTRSDGGIKACGLDRLLHDYCTHRARDEKFFHFIKGFEELSAFNERPDLRRLSIESKPEHFKESKLFCPRAGSLLFMNSQQTEREEGEELFFDVSFLIRTFKFLHVLDIGQINVGHVFPSELEVLVQLAFVAMRGEMRQIPSSIDKLSKLETLIVDAGTETVALPDSLGNLLSLEFLYIRSLRSSGGATLSATNPSVLHGLGTFCGVVVPSWGILERLMRKFPNIRKLKCRRGMDDTGNVEKSVVLEFLSHLEALHLSSVNPSPFKFRLPETLKKLTLSGFHLVAKKMSTLGQMPNLQVLKLLHVSFAGNIWEVQEEEFCNLRALKLHSPGLVRWSGAYEYYLWSLEKLALDGCQVLEEVPFDIGYYHRLRVIEVNNCSKTVVDSVMEILEIQKKGGNAGLKVCVDGAYRV